MRACATATIALVAATTAPRRSIEKKVTMPTRRHNVIGALVLIIGAIGFVTAEAFTARGWTDPPYNYRFDFISDLGNPVPHDFVFGRTVNSSRYFVMIFGFVAQGIMFAIAAVLLYRLLVPVCARLLEAAAAAGEIVADVEAYGLMRGVDNICIGVDTDPDYDARRMVQLVIAGLRPASEQQAGG